MRVFIILVFSWLTLPGYAQTILKTDQITSLEVLARSADKVLVGDVITGFELIPLETSTDVLFGEVHGLRFHKGHFYISDGRPMNLFMFDETGKYKGKVSKRGNGPGEYASLNNFNIDRESEEVIIYSNNGMSLYHYDLNGAFLKRQKLDFLASSFEIIDENHFGFHTNYQTSAFGRKNVLVTNREGKVQEHLISFPKSVDRSVGFSGSFRAFGKKLFFNHAYSDTLWVMNLQLTVKQALVFDFEGRQWDHGFAFQKITTDYSYLGKRLLSDERFLFLSFIYKGYYRPVIYSWDNERLYNEHSFKNPFLFRLVKTPATSLGKGTYLSIINAQSLSWLINANQEEWEGFQQEYPQQAEILNRLLEEEANPVIIKFKVN